ncbi:hypothetical protein [Pyxidicoccus sp. MSG2]|uniref:hypothetical protein n=1 Tax=Pyxidicoccus sp. MSG2 TaxID=2996790 RepID=UPI002270461E|nr:hypothetical protein [Pyxidicoccus sp. MSG2]MCY1023434.1 hypothetical protein [Pyxidicoccus sp. MSG2]
MRLRCLPLCFVLLACASSKPSRTEVSPPPQPQVKKLKGPFGTEYFARGNCLIIEPRSNPDVEWVDDGCDKNVQGDIGEAFNWFVDRLPNAFGVAEQLMCGKPGCAAKDRAVRFYVTWGQVPWLTSNSDDEHIEIRMSTALVQLIESTALTYLAEAKANGQGDGARFTKWLEDISAKAGKACVPMDRPERGMKLQQEDIENVLRMSQPVYVFTMLHELEHIVRGRDCGAGLNADELTRELACDELAFDDLGNIPNARFPTTLLVPMILLSHHQALMDPLLAREKGLPEGRLYSEEFIASQWHLRAEVLTNRWETHCFEGKSADDLTCKWWRELVDHVRGYLLKPLPGSCGTQPRRERAAIVPDPAALACLRLVDGRTDVSWVRDGNPPIVKVVTGYENTCNRPVRCEAQVQTGTKPVKGKEAGQLPWLMVNAVAREFDVPPGQLHRMNATVTWTRTEDRFPSVRYAIPGSPDRELATCEFTGLEAKEDDLAWNDAWCKALGRMEDAAAQHFSPLAEGTPHVTKRGLKVFKTRLLLPGASECDINQDEDSAWVSCNYDYFQSEAAVTREYGRAVTAAKACLVGATAEEEVDDEDDRRRRATSLTRKGLPMEVKLERDSVEGDDGYHTLEVDVWLRAPE